MNLIIFFENGYNNKAQVRSDSFGLKNCCVTCIGAGTLDPQAFGTSEDHGNGDDQI